MPNQSIELRNIAHGVRIKHWRGVAHNFNLFAIEGLIDEMAADQGIDPIDVPARAHGGDGARPKSVRTGRADGGLDREASRWPCARRRDHRALGLARRRRGRNLGRRATPARSACTKSGSWSMAGIIVQPEAARANIESGIMYGLSNVLHERVTLKDGAVEQSNFNDYNVMRMSDMPEEIHIAFIDSDGRPTGLGEVGTPFVMPAVANAFYRLTGKRLYHMPFTAERVQATLKA